MLIIIVSVLAHSCAGNPDNMCSVQERVSALCDSAKLQFDSHEYAKCVVSLLEAEQDALSLGDDYLLGCIYRGLKDAYGVTYNVEDELKYAELSYNCFLRTDSARSAEFALLDLGSAYINVGNYEKGLKILRNSVGQFQENGDTLLGVTSLRLYSEALVITGNYAKAKNILLSLLDSKCGADYLSARNYKDLAVCYRALQMPDSAAYCLDVAESKARNAGDNLLVCRIGYEKGEVEGNSQRATSSLIGMMFWQDSIMRAYMNAGILNAREVYFRNRSEIAELKAERERWTFIGVVSLVTLVAVGVVIILVRRHKRNIRRKDEELAQVRENMKEISVLLDVHSADVSRMKLLVKKLFDSKFEMINELCNTYFECQNTQREKNTIYREAILAINSFTEPRVLRDLENIVNECNDNVVARMRDQIPGLGEKDIALLLYICSGFSPRAVCLFTDDKVENYYNRKSRLKSKIVKSGARDVQDFVQLLNNQ